MDGSWVDVGARRIWFAETGRVGAPALVLLHPGGVDARAFEPSLETLGEHFRLYLPERRGHGHVPDDGDRLSFEEDARDTAAFVERVPGGPVRLLGCSDGGVVALRTAVTRPDLVERLVVVAAPAHVDGWASGLLDELDDEPPELLAASYGEISPDGAEHYPVLARRLAELHRREPRTTADELASVAVRTLVMVADDDEVSLEHAVATHRALPRGELAVVPGTSHGLLWEKPDVCHAILLDFLRHDAVETFAPRRRA